MTMIYCICTTYTPHTEEFNMEDYRYDINEDGTITPDPDYLEYCACYGYTDSIFIDPKDDMTGRW